MRRRLGYLFRPASRHTGGGCEILIGAAGLSVRAENALRRAGFERLGDIARVHSSELEAIPNLGRKTLEEIIATLREHGLGTRADRGPVGKRPPQFSYRMPKPTGVLTAPGHGDGSLGSGAARSQPPMRVDPRRERIISMRRAGLTLREIADHAGVSPERVRQIVSAAGVSARQVTDERRARRLTGARAAAEQLLRAFRTGEEPAATAAELGVDPVAAREVVRELATTADRAERRRNMSAARRRSVYTDQALIDAVRSVAEHVGGVPSSNDYARQAAVAGLPSLPTVANRFGTWANAVRAAGMEPNVPNRDRYHRRWTEAACWASLARLIEELGDPPTAQQYDVLASANEDLPSLATVRNRLGPWSDVIARLVVGTDVGAILERIGIDPDMPRDVRNERIWLAHLEGEIEDEELIQLLRAGAFAWHASYGPRPDGMESSGTESVY
ncbi:MAG TPA: DNA-directed RNA polymerase subunit alpha C-terminal domain-containing protein [Thermoleophilaceae bacterium]|nr:DNA-directed RNA polymerase subunit alpha C-terminal domain-containing protein [Thermoleophilaceae bacterium]